MNFEDLQQAWQKQEGPELGDPKNVNSGQNNILDQVKKLQRKVMISNVAMSVCLILTCVFYVYFWLESHGKTIWFDLGMVLVLGAMILVGVLVWLRTIPWGNLNPDLSNREYINGALKAFKFRQSSLKIVMPVYMLTLYLGVTFIYLDIFREATWQTRVGVHVGFTVFMVVIGSLSLFYQRKKYKKNFDPVIKELEIIKQEFEEQFQQIG